MSVTNESERVHGQLSDCDLVMKGGITSGVVYPSAIVELARDHRFHHIGGASAGAIAAVAAAAAEYGRQATDEFGQAAEAGGFDTLAAIPDELAATDDAATTKLQRLFVPQAGTAKYFDLFWEQKQFEGGAFGRVWKLLRRLWRHGPLVPKTWIGRIVSIALPVAALVWLVIAPAAATVALFLLAAAVGIAVYLAARAVGGAVHVVSDAQKQLEANMHGLCNGRSEDGQVGLTDWLHDKIESMAGAIRLDLEHNRVERPLTYGDLRRYDVGLVTLTTNLSQSSSEQFPFTEGMWAFDPDDVRTLFPDDVAKHLIERGKIATAASVEHDTPLREGLLRLPPPDELPVLLGARVSLSFPVMISAVPLWRPDDTGEYRQVWLSDGGICSNMPVHLFDAPLPRWPTYGINLGSDANPSAENEHENVWRPIRADAGDEAPIASIDSTLALLSEVFNTMQNWSDNSMSRAIGVRDRICTIRLGKGEGGMNLDMDAGTIRGLVPRGRAAGENLGWIIRGETPGDVTPPVPDDQAATQWTRHRWTRLRAMALGAGRFAEEVGARWNGDEAPLPQRGPLANEHSYRALAEGACTLEYLPFRSEWPEPAGVDLVAGVDHLTALAFTDANTFSPPPRRRLVLSPRTEAD